MADSSDLVKDLRNEAEFLVSQDAEYVGTSYEGRFDETVRALKSAADVIELADRMAEAIELWAPTHQRLRKAREDYERDRRS